MDDKLTEQIIGAAFTVHNKLGFGFLESVYEKALAMELSKDGLDQAIGGFVPGLGPWCSSCWAFFDREAGPQILSIRIAQVKGCHDTSLQLLNSAQSGFLTNQDTRHRWNTSRCSFAGTVG